MWGSRVSKRTKTNIFPLPDRNAWAHYMKDHSKRLRTTAVEQSFRLYRRTSKTRDLTSVLNCHRPKPKCGRQKQLRRRSADNPRGMTLNPYPFGVVHDPWHSMTISPYYSLSDRSSPGESVLSLRPGGGRGCGDGQRAELLGELAGGRDWLVTGSASSLGLPSCVRSCSWAWHAANAGRWQRPNTQRTSI